VRDADFLINPAGGGVQVLLAITSLLVVVTNIYYDVSASSKYSSWRGRQVLYAGEELSVAVAGTGNADATVSGYQLTLP